jgi:hypothetical protein
MDAGRALDGDSATELDVGAGAEHVLRDASYLRSARRLASLIAAPARDANVASSLEVLAAHPFPGPPSRT